MITCVFCPLENSIFIFVISSYAPFSLTNSSLRAAKLQSILHLCTIMKLFQSPIFIFKLERQWRDLLYSKHFFKLMIDVIWNIFDKHNYDSNINLVLKIYWFQASPFDWHVCICFADHPLCCLWGVSCQRSTITSYHICIV